MRTTICLAMTLWAGLAVGDDTQPTTPKPVIIDAAVATAASVATTERSKTPSARPLHHHPTLFSMLQKSNYIRRYHGLAPHRMNPILCLAAQDHANYMARTGEFDHYVNDGPQHRARKYGFRTGVWENIAVNGNSVSYAFTQWVNSPPHFAALLEQQTTDAGFGYAVGRYGEGYFVCVYGASTGEAVSETEEQLAAKFAAEKPGAADNQAIRPVSATSEPKPAGSGVPASGEQPTTGG
jgi:uncharacterized protein YkwD